MKIKLLAYLLILTITNVNLSVADDCNKFDKLSKEYAKCNAEKIKRKSSKKAKELKDGTSKKTQKLKEGTSKKAKELKENLVEIGDKVKKERIYGKIK